MTPDQWNQLETEALWQLEHPDQLPPRDLFRGMAMQLRLWRHARSGPRVSWSILLPVREFRTRRAVVREVVWDRIADLKRRRNPLEALKRRQGAGPAIRCRDAEVDWSDLSPYLDIVGGLRSPMPVIAPKDPPKVDSFGLEGHRSIAHIRLHWEGKGPRGWGDTVAWVGRLRDVLIRAMRERDTEVRQG